MSERDYKDDYLRAARTMPYENPLYRPTCGKYLGDNDATCPQLTCIRPRGHDGPCDNTSSK